MGDVSWSEKKLSDGNVRLTLKAVAEDGCAFAGWSVAESDVVSWSDDFRYPGSLTATVTSNAAVVATFVTGADDSLSFDISMSLPDELVPGENVFETLGIDSSSFPTVTFGNLPTGLSYDERTLTVFGTPTEPGVYRVEADAVNGSGFTYRSCTTLRVANVAGARVSGDDVEIPCDEYFYSEIGLGDISDIFTFAETPTSVRLTGSVPGLVWEEDWQLLYGTPTRIGEYVLRVSANFPTGRVETATLLLTVTGADAEEYDLDLDVFENLQVGDFFEDEYQFGVDSPDVAIRAVSGLPTGLEVASRYEDGARRWFVSGRVVESGFFTPTVRLEDRRDETQRVVQVVRTVTVADVPDVYLGATSADPSQGTVSGGGAVRPYADVTLAANARTGFVFAGWYGAEGEPLVLREGVDYRTPSVTLPAGTDFAFLAPVAHFAARSDDEAPDLTELEDSEFSLMPDEPFETVFSVGSLSLPTLTFKGLPKGLTCAATGTGDFVLAYDPWSAVAVSGRYTVTATAVNGSGRSSTVTFRITVEPQIDVRIHVYDDYGEFPPGEEIDPIDFSDAVDFARGETLSVSGLPKGLVYNSKANAKKGIGAQTVTGTPTVPGDYTLKFTAKVVSGVTTNRSGKVSYQYETATATSFLTVLPYPQLVIEVDEDAVAAGCKVTGAGSYKSGTKVTLKATAAKGWVFAGWEGLDDVDGLKALNPKLTFVTGEDDAWVQAYFVPVSEDALSISAPQLTERGFAAEWALKSELDEGDASLIADLIETVSWPTVKVDGLPDGVKFSATTLELSGTPKKSGVFHITVRAQNAGGYSFVRVIDVAVRNADGSLPQEKALENAAAVDFGPLKGLMTGTHCPAGAVVVSVGPKPGTGFAVKKIAVSGLPAGLSASVAIVDDGAEVAVTGTPTKPGRFVVTLSVTYADGKTLKSQAAVVVADGGSSYLFVSADDPNGGSVSGEGVYAAGATVKLVAKAAKKCVFSGWCVADDEGELSLFEPLREIDGIDPRTPTVAFVFRPSDFSGFLELTGTFAASARDVAPVILLEDAVWEIDPSCPTSLTFAVQSLSVPKVSVTGLPKGVAVDAVRGVLSYEVRAETAPGIYTATVSAKNATVSKATSKTLEVRVANRVSDVIHGLDPDPDAYRLPVGTTVDPSLIAPTVDESWTLTVKGLPAGLSYKNGTVTGVPSKAGDYTVTFTATTGTGSAKRTETATITVRVAALPITLTGAFAGVLTDEDDAVVGTVAITATSAGKVTVAAKTAAKSVSFSAKSWAGVREGVATATMTGKGGASCALEVESTDDWQSWQATGEVVLSAGDRPLRFEAQRNPYGAKDGDAEARAKVAAMAGTSKIDGWTVKLSANGTVKVTGKYAGKSLSGSTTLQWDEGCPFARYVAFIGKDSVVCFVFEYDENGRVVQWSVD